MSPRLHGLLLTDLIEVVSVVLRGRCGRVRRRGFRYNVYYCGLELRGDTECHVSGPATRASSVPDWWVVHVRLCWGHCRIHRLRWRLKQQRKHNSNLQNHADFDKVNLNKWKTATISASHLLIDRIAREIWHFRHVLYRSNRPEGDSKTGRVYRCTSFCSMISATGVLQSGEGVGSHTLSVSVFSSDRVSTSPEPLQLSDGREATAGTVNLQEVNACIFSLCDTVKVNTLAA